MLRAWLGDSWWRWAYYRTVYYGARVLMSGTLLALAYLLDILIPRAVEWAATIVVLYWTHHAARVSENTVAAAKLREKLKRQQTLWALVMAGGVVAAWLAGRKGATSGVTK